MQAGPTEAAPYEVLYASVRVLARTWSEKRRPKPCRHPIPTPGGRSEPSIPGSRPGRLVGGTWTAPCAVLRRGRPWLSGATMEMYM